MKAIVKSKNHEQCLKCGESSLSLYAHKNAPNIVIAKEICSCSPKYPLTQGNFFSAVEGQCPYCEAMDVWWVPVDEGEIRIALSCSFCQQILLDNTWLSLDQIRNLHESQKGGIFSRAYRKLYHIIATMLNGIWSGIRFLISLPYKLIVQPFSDGDSIFRIILSLSIIAGSIIGTILCFLHYAPLMETYFSPSDIYVVTRDSKTWYVKIDAKGGSAQEFDGHRQWSIDPTLFYKIHTPLLTQNLKNCAVSQKIRLKETEEKHFEVFKVEGDDSYTENAFTVCKYAPYLDTSLPYINQHPVMVVSNTLNVCFDWKVNKQFTPTNCPKE